MVNIVWFEDYHPDRAERLGGKNTSLAVMTSAGLPVPPVLHPDVVLSD